MVSSCSTVGSVSDDIKNGFVYLEAKDSAVYHVHHEMAMCKNSSMLQPFFINPGGDEADWRRLASMSDVVSMWGEMVYHIYIYTLYIYICIHNIRIYIYMYIIHLYICRHYIYIYILNIEGPHNNIGKSHGKHLEFYLPCFCDPTDAA